MSARPTVGEVVAHLKGQFPDDRVVQYAARLLEEYHKLACYARHVVKAPGHTQRTSGEERCLERLRALGQAE